MSGFKEILTYCIDIFILLLMFPLPISLCIILLKLCRVNISLFVVFYLNKKNVVYNNLGKKSEHLAQEG